MNLVQQTGAAAVFKNRVFTRSQSKYLLQNLHAISYRPGVWERAKVMVSLIHFSAIRGEPRKFMSGQHYIGVRLVIPKENIKRRG